MRSFPDDACGHDAITPASVERRAGFGDRLEGEPVRFGNWHDDLFRIVDEPGARGCEPLTPAVAATVAARCERPLVAEPEAG